MNEESNNTMVTKLFSTNKNVITHPFTKIAEQFLLAVHEEVNGQLSFEGY